MGHLLMGLWADGYSILIIIIIVIIITIIIIIFIIIIITIIILEPPEGTGARRVVAQVRPSGKASSDVQLHYV